MFIYNYYNLNFIWILNRFSGISILYNYLFYYIIFYFINILKINIIKYIIFNNNKHYFLNILNILKNINIKKELYLFKNKVNFRFYIYNNYLICDIGYTNYIILKFYNIKLYTIKKNIIKIIYYLYDFIFFNNIIKNYISIKKYNKKLKKGLFIKKNNDK